MIDRLLGFIQWLEFLRSPRKYTRLELWAARQRGKIMAKKWNP